MRYSLPYSLPYLPPVLPPVLPPLLPPLRPYSHAPKHATPDPALESEESDDQLSRMFVNNVVKELLGGLENAGGGDDVKGTRILRGFLNNKRVGELVNRLLAGDEQLPGNAGRLQTDTRMADRLAEAISLLKNKTSSLHEWHAYSSILTALTPSAESESWEFTQVLKRLDLSSDKALLAAAARKSSLIETDSDAEELWFAQEKRKYKNSFAEKQSKHIPTIENFWITNTQASPGINSVGEGPPPLLPPVQLPAFERGLWLRVHAELRQSLPVMHESQRVRQHTVRVVQLHRSF